MLSKVLLRDATNTAASSGVILLRSRKSAPAENTLEEDETTMTHRAFDISLAEVPVSERQPMASWSWESMVRPMALAASGRFKVSVTTPAHLPWRGCIYICLSLLSSMLESALSSEWMKRLTVGNEESKKAAFVLASVALLYLMLFEESYVP